MKKIFTAVLVAVLAVGFVPRPASADLGDVTVIGAVFDHGQPVSGAVMTVECKEGHVTRDYLSAADGSYKVYFYVNECWPGAHILVSATKGNKSGSTLSLATSETTRIDVDVTNIGIPEYDQLAVILAVGAGTSAVVLARRRILRIGRGVA